MIDLPELPEGWVWEIVNDSIDINPSMVITMEPQKMPILRLRLINELGKVVKDKELTDTVEFSSKDRLLSMGYKQAGLRWNNKCGAALGFVGVKVLTDPVKIVEVAAGMLRVLEDEMNHLREQERLTQERARVYAEEEAKMSNLVGTYPPKKLSF